MGIEVLITAITTLTIPILAVFFVIHRYTIHGIIITGVKG